MKHYLTVKPRMSMHPTTFQPQLMAVYAIERFDEMSEHPQTSFSAWVDAFRYLQPYLKSTRVLPKYILTSSDEIVPWLLHGLKECQDTAAAIQHSALIIDLAKRVGYWNLELGIIERSLYSL